MNIAELDKAREKVNEFIGLLTELREHELQISDMGWNSLEVIDIAYKDREADKVRRKIRELKPLIQSISKRIIPDSYLNTFKLDEYNWIINVTAEAEELIRMINLMTTDKEILGSESPALAVRGLHPWIREAAMNLWDNGHYKQAVENAWNNLVRHTQNKTGSKSTGTKLYSNLFKGNSKDDRPLGFPEISQETEDWKSAHQGAHHYGMGCALRIRNLTAHTTDKLDEQKALEYLAALSVLARWVDEATVFAQSARGSVNKSTGDAVPF